VDVPSVVGASSVGSLALLLVEAFVPMLLFLVNILRGKMTNPEAEGLG